MYIYDNVVILSPMWYVLRFEHAHELKRYNDRRMTRDQTSLFHSYNFYCRFPENDCSFDGLLTESSVKAVAIFLFLAFKSTPGAHYLLLCHAMKMCHVCYYNISDATFRLLMYGKINPSPGPVSASTAGKINCLVMDARSLKSYHTDSTTNWATLLWATQ